MTKQGKALIDKAINIKGKNYVLVSDRVIYFNDEYPNGAIENSYELVNDTYHFKSVVTPDVDKPLRRFIGHSQATIGDGMVNKTAAMENAETSAVGRAMAMMGIGVIESIASADEMNKATGSAGIRKATDKQLNWIRTTAQRQYNTDEVDQAVEDLIGKPMNEIGIGEVKSIVDRIQADNPPATNTVIHIEGKELNLDDIPY